MRLTNFDGNNHNYCIPRKDFVLNLTVDGLCYGNVVDTLGQYEDIDESPQHLAKVKKAFDIIKEKQVDLKSLHLAFDFDNEKNSELLLENYNGAFYGSEYECFMLTMVEYRLLKEVLL